MQTNRCPSDAELLSLHSSSTRDSVCSEIAEHVDACEHCQSKMMELKSGGNEKPHLADEVTRIWDNHSPREADWGDRETCHESSGAEESADQGGLEVESRNESLHGGNGAPDHRG